MSYRNTICELCSKWGLCKLQNEQNLQNNNQGVERVVSTRVGENNLTVAVSLQNNSPSRLSVENSNDRSSPVLQTPFEQKTKQQFLKFTKIPLFISRQSTFNVRTGRIGGESDIELNNVTPFKNLTNKSFVPSPEKSLVTSTDVDEYSREGLNHDLLDAYRELTISNGLINASPLKDPRTTLSCQNVDRRNDLVTNGGKLLIVI